MKIKSFSDYADFSDLQDESLPEVPAAQRLASIGDLLERDSQREKDGFPRKIRIGRIVKPGRGLKEKIVIVPTTVEEKFLHDTREQDQEEAGQAGGAGEGEEGQVVGEEPVHGEEGSGAGGPGQGEGGEHEIEAGAYDLGRVISEQFELPNLKAKGRRRFLKKFSYELTDRHEGFGQLLDKKATLRKIIETNIGLDKIPDVSDIDPTKLLVSPEDSVYRILSPERDLESQALVFFVRDYSGSMWGKPTELVVAQHVLIYSWLMFQYERQVVTRFILHDTTAREVSDFYTYYSLKVAGGTKMESAYRMINEIVEADSLDRDYNIYVFHGSDGDDWERDGKTALAQLRKMIGYCSRIGITITPASMADTTTAERYIRDSKILEEHPKEIRLDTIDEDAGDMRLIEGIRKLIS
ncbi:MAG: hypothetical protein CVU61_11795 [Deltaproteobacteria bacterium HGW-Deltaproteobacteria-19]|jgi:hypothetical protein|nr:MAG: hypothetical protein CVU61_11795 [Deltaproteobacteria bacterium HGW-Deltaproteobacteria-19]